MPEDIPKTETLLSRLALLEEKLDNTVLAFCGDQEGERLALWEKTARTIAALLRESERLEEMKNKYEHSGSKDGDRKYDPEEIRRIEERLLRKIDRVADTIRKKRMGQGAERSGKGGA